MIPGERSRNTGGSVRVAPVDVSDVTKSSPHPVLLWRGLIAGHGGFPSLSIVPPQCVSRAGRR
jgi:hypothetical protein